MQAAYTVLFSNLTGCAVGISDINWSVKVVADSEASAIELALEQARVLNDKKGMPPHGIHVRDEDLRNLAFVYSEPVPPGDSGAG